MSLKVYVAMPFARQAEARIIHERLRELGIEPTAHWPYRQENEQDLSVALARLIASENDCDLHGSHAVLVLAYPAQGGEMFAEARLAIEYGIPIVWVGRSILSTLRRGVVRAPGLDEALATLAGWVGAIKRPWPTDVEWVRSAIRDEIDAAESQRGAEAAQ